MPFTSANVEGMGVVSETYVDGTIECASEHLLIHRYYFPLGTKSIRYSSIRSLRRVEIGSFNGQWRLWGTANPRYWANLDPARPTKKVGLIIDVGRMVKPFITPSNTDKVELIIRERAHLASPTDTGRSPIL